MDVTSLQLPPPTRQPDGDALQRLETVYRRVAGGIADALRPHGLLVGRAGRAIAIVGRRPRRRPGPSDRGRIAAWFATRDDIHRLFICGPVVTAPLDQHLLAVHSEGIADFPWHDFALSSPIAPLVTMARPLREKLLDATRGGAPLTVDDLGDDAMLAAVTYVGQLERLATQMAMALHDARRQRRESRHGRR